MARRPVQIGFTLARQASMSVEVITRSSKCVSYLFWSASKSQIFS